MLLCTYKRRWKWCPWVSIQAWTRSILFANAFCRSVFGKSLCTYNRCWKWCPPASIEISTRIVVFANTFWKSAFRKSPRTYKCVRSNVHGPTMHCTDIATHTPKCTTDFWMHHTSVYLWILRRYLMTNYLWTCILSFNYRQKARNCFLYHQKCHNIFWFTCQCLQLFRLLGAEMQGKFSV
jgi:hypothetical protein